MRIARLCAVLLLSAVLTGCLQATTLITVRPDGSGTIEQTMAMTAQAVAQLQMMESMAGEKGAAGKARTGMFNVEEARAAAAKMGEGVTFVSAQPIKTAQQEGMKATYAFTDITKIRVNQKPSGPGGAAAGGGPKLMAGGAEDVLFRFTRNAGGTSTVTVVFPQVDAAEARKQVDRATDRGGRGSSAMPPEAMAMMKPFLDGMHIAIVLQPAGRIVKANTPFVEGQKVTLLDIDMTQLLANPGSFEKLQGANSLEQAKTLLKDVKGVKFNPEKEVAIEFAGK